MEIRRHPKLQRLKTRRQFQTVLSAGVVARTPHFAWHRACIAALPPNAGMTLHPGPSEPLLFPAPDVWLGAMVPKRWAKRAVTRNAIRRQIYSMSGDFGLTLGRAAHVVRLRAGFDRAKFPSASSEALVAAVRCELQQLFERAAAVAAGVSNPQSGGA